MITARNISCQQRLTILLSKIVEQSHTIRFKSRLLLSKFIPFTVRAYVLKNSFGDFQLSLLNAERHLNSNFEIKWTAKLSLLDFA